MGSGRNSTTLFCVFLLQNVVYYTKFTWFWRKNGDILYKKVGILYKKLEK